MEKLTFRLERLASLRGEAGQTMAEYAVVIAVITLTIIGAIELVSGNTTAAITRIAGYIP